MIFSYTGVENILGQMLKVFREDGGPVPEILLVLLAVSGPAFDAPDPLPRAVLPLVFAMPFVQGRRQFHESKQRKGQEVSAPITCSRALLARV